MAESDKGETQSVQSYAALGIGLVVIVIGLPLWWKTTEVYRVSLPYGEMEELAAAPLSYVVDFHVVSCNKAEAPNGKLLSVLHLLLNNNEEIHDERFNVQYRGQSRVCSERERKIVEEAQTSEDADERLDELTLRQSGNYTIYLLPYNTQLVKPSSVAMAVVGRHRAAFINVANDAVIVDGDDALADVIAYLLRDVYANHAAIQKAFQATSVSTTNMKADKESMRSLKLSLGYDITLTLFNPQPDILRVRWDIRGAISKYLDPLFAVFREFADIKVTSQFLYHVGLGVQPTRDEAAKCSILKVDQLPHIINPIEARLGSHVSNNPNINFVVYIPTMDQTPLKIYDSSNKPSESNAFFSPRWGGLVIHNIESLTDENTSYPLVVDVDMKPVMAVFTAQLRLLLGIHSVVTRNQVTILPQGKRVIADWELDSWLRKRSVENIATSATTLQSLAELLGKIENLVINDDIGDQVVKAVKFLKRSKSFLIDGKLKDAFLNSREAFKSSEKAFFDPSLLELLYFPEDQKFAIYIPLFLPIGIPIVLSIIQAFKWLRSKDVKAKTE